MKLRPLPAEETEGVMYYDPAATGERIQNLRKDREVTQEQLAIDLNISDRYMRNLEKGEKVPSVDRIFALDKRVHKVQASQSDTTSHIFFCNSEGVMFYDYRPMVTLGAVRAAFSISSTVIFST